MSLSSDTEDFGMAGLGREHARHALLARYARGRVSHFLFRQILTALGAAVLFTMNGPVSGTWALVLALLGEAIDCLFLSGVEKRLKNGWRFARVHALSVVTAVIQAMTIAGCVALSWYGPITQNSPLFAMAFLTGAAVNAGIVLPYHSAAAVARLLVYGAVAVFLFLEQAWTAAAFDAVFAMNAAGAVVLAYMVVNFIGFVTSSFRRNRRNLAAIARQGSALERTNKELRAREREARRLSLAVRNANDAVILSGPDGRIEWTNDAFTRITGYAPDEARGCFPGELLNGPETCERTIADLRDAVSRGIPFRGEIRNRTKAGADIWIETNLVPVLDGDGRSEMVVAVERDITAQKNQEEELARAKSAAEDGARAKAEFLATMSHEIRTPMNGVIGMAELLGDSPLSRDQRLFVDTIHSSARALLTIINDILDLSKLEAGKVALDPVEFAPIDCLRGVANLMRPQAEEKGLELRLELSGHLPQFVVGDDGRIRQVLINLLGNAIKFTETGHVAMRADAEQTQDGWSLKIEVVDSGIGIPADKIDKIFESFSQAEDSTTRRFGGTGLGLTISRMLVEAMGGEITATSTPDEGSRFAFSVEVMQAKEPEAALEPPGKAMGSAVEFEGVKVLVAEDNRTNRLLIRKYLGESGLDLRFAHNGQQAVDMALSDTPDVLFMDMSMPVKGGLDATREIRAAGGKQPAIVALTANAFADDRAACLASGMDGFLTKPVRRSDLVACIEQHCSRLR